MLRKNQNGFSIIEVIIVLAALAVIGGIVFFAATGRFGDKNNQSTNNQQGSEASAVQWSFNGQTWEPSGTPPACPDPLVVKSPVDVPSVSAILYPGQTRGLYKAHGGFRFEQVSNSVTVTAPLDAQVIEGSRYIEQGEVQYYFVFINPCGIMYKFDHLLTLEPKFQAIADSFPVAKPDDSRTTKLEAPVSVMAGEKIATEVGFKNSNNVSVDFGLYDLRQPNGVTLSGGQDDTQFAPFGLCWLDYLGVDSDTVKALPGGDAKAGKTSDYCN